MVTTHLLVGGLIAVGFDPTEAFLLTVSHSGRGVFDTRTWQRIARDHALAYPEAGVAIGIGPIGGMRIAIAELDSDHPIRVSSPSGQIQLHCESSGIEVILFEK